MQNSIIHPIRISTPFAVGDVFCYLLVDDKTVLVDTGQHTDDAYSKIEKEFGKFGLAINDLDEIWLTHGHPDHFGQAARLADRAGATVFGHPKERANFAGNDDGDLFEDFFLKHNIPGNLIQKMVDQLDWLQQFQIPLKPEWIEDGDVLSSGELSVTVHHTPGHAPGHLTFASNDEIVFGGDLLLGHISTNALINFDPETEQRNKSLLQYRKSLQWMRNQEGKVLPGHGKVIRDICGIADDHLQEHQKRYTKIRQLLQQNSMSLMELSYQMFPDAIKAGAIFLVLSEVLGYLDWGMEEGVIQINESNMNYIAVGE